MAIPSKKLWSKYSKCSELFAMRYSVSGTWTPILFASNKDTCSIWFPLTENELACLIPKKIKQPTATNQILNKLTLVIFPIFLRFLATTVSPTYSKP